MSDERPGEQGPPTVRLDLGDVAGCLQRSAQQAAPAEPDQHDEPPGDASEQPAPPLAEDADLGAQDSPALALDAGDIEAAPPVGGGAHDTTEPGRPTPADDTFAAGHDAPSPADVGEAGSLVAGAMPGSDDRSTIEAEAPPFEPEGGTGADDHGPPGPAGVGEAGPSRDDAPEDTGNERATDTPAEPSDAAATAWSAVPAAQSDRPGGDQEVGVPGEGADGPPTVSTVADAAVQETPADGWAPDDDDDVAAGGGRPRLEGPDPRPSSALLLPPADPGSASIDPPLAEDIGLVDGRQTEPATPPDDAASDNGAVERGGASRDEGGGAGAPDPGPSPVEASPASVEGTGVDEWAGGGERANDLGSVALFELDLAKLADRARASARREAAPPPLDPGPEPDPSPGTARDLQDPLLAPAPEPLPAPAPILDPFPASEPFTAPSTAVNEPAQPVGPGPAQLVWGDATQAFDLSGDEEDAEDAETDSTEADTAAGHPRGKLDAPVPAAARTRRSKRPRYPGGQLREPIGILRRIRAMLGIVVVTVLLGIAAGTAVGAFIFFLAFAVRNAITAQ